MHPLALIALALLPQAAPAQTRHRPGPHGLTQFRLPNPPVGLTLIPTTDGSSKLGTCP